MSYFVYVLLYFVHFYCILRMLDCILWMYWRIWGYLPDLTRLAIFAWFKKDIEVEEFLYSSMRYLGVDYVQIVWRNVFLHQWWGLLHAVGNCRRLLTFLNTFVYYSRWVSSLSLIFLILYSHPIGMLGEGYRAEYVGMTKLLNT